MRRFTLGQPAQVAVCMAPPLPATDVHLWIQDQDGPAAVVMTPDQARKLAVRLVRAADFIEELADA